MPDLQFVPPGGHTREQQAERVEDDQAEEPGLRPVCLLWTHHWTLVNISSLGGPASGPQGQWGVNGSSLLSTYFWGY